MINDGQVYLAGYVASPPVCRISNGKPTTTVRVAFTPRWRSRETGEWADGPTSFVNVSCWRMLATHVAMSLHKGEPVLVMGRLRVRRYADREGTPKTAVEVEANSIGHDLTRGVTMFSRLRRPAGETAEETAARMAATVLAAQAGGAALEEAASEELEELDTDAVAAFASEMTEALTGAALTGAGEALDGAAESAEPLAESAEPLAESAEPLAESAESAESAGPLAGAGLPS